MMRNQTGNPGVEASLERAAGLMAEALVLLDATGAHFAAALLDHALSLATDRQSRSRAPTSRPADPPPSTRALH